MYGISFDARFFYINRTVVIIHTYIRYKKAFNSLGAGSQKTICGIFIQANVENKMLRLRKTCIGAQG